MKIIKEAWTEIEEMIRGRFRYLYLPLPSEVNLDEWIGEQGQSESVYKFLNFYMKKAFILGHKYGSLAAIEKIGGEDFELDEDLDRQYASDTWDKLQED